MGDEANPNVVLVATGSEVALCRSAAQELSANGIRARVVSMPCQSRFLAQDLAYRSSVLPPNIPVVAVEAGSSFGWEGLADKVIGIDQFGTSAPGGVALEHLGISVTNVVAGVRALISG